MNAGLVDLLQSFGRQKILLVGDFMLDRYVFGDAERISPEAPVPVLKVVTTEHRLGGAGSVAANLAALGADVLCCGLIGRDAEGQRLQALLAEAGCRTDGLIRLANRPTTTKTRLVGLAQHRHRQQLIRVDQEDARPPSRQTVRSLQARIGQAIDSVDLLCLQDYHKGVLTDELTQAAIQAATRAGKPALVDPAALQRYDKYRGATLLTPNRSEFERVVRSRLADLEQMGHLASQLVQQLQLGGIVVTLDRDGALLVRPEAEPLHVPTRPRPVYDNTGAGDEVLAMLAAAIAAGGTYQQAVQLANIAAGLEVERFGCVPIRREEVLAELLAQARQQRGKLRNLQQLLAEVAELRRQGRTIVFTNGCFDLLHPGHLALLQFCRQQGDVLIVGLDSDQSIRCQNKAPDRPIFNQDERLRMISAIECVDYVVFFDDADPTGLIRAIKPDILVKGADCAVRGVRGRQIVEGYGGRVLLAPFLQGYSTTAVLQRIRNAAPEVDPAAG
ncbi:MAG: PfkB family carbohydrate kinase, partial [Phycisphaerae bacterium]